MLQSRRHGFDSPENPANSHREPVVVFRKTRRHRYFDRIDCNILGDGEVDTPSTLAECKSRAFLGCEFSPLWERLVTPRPVLHVGHQPGLRTCH